MKRHSIDHLNFEAEGATETQRAVDSIKTTFSPATPCVNVGADGYCTGPCQGAICCGCADYKPVTAVAVPADKVTALTVRVAALAIPEGSPAEQANALHGEFLQNAVSAKIRAVQCGWVLAAQRERLGHGQWMSWVERNLDFSHRTVNNYITAYDNTVGAYRAQQRRPLPLSVEPTMEEIMAATANAQEKPLAALYRETGVVANNPNHGGAREGAGRKPGALPKLTATQEAETLWAQVAELAEALKLQVRELRGVR